jgi:c-di-GMP-binding flagellar brake protein YcgR
MKITYEVIDKVPMMAESKDISGGGMRIALGEKLPEGTNLKLNVEVPGEKNRTTVIYGVVVWTSKLEVVAGSKSTNYYETGIRFTNADPLVLGLIFKNFQKKS